METKKNNNDDKIREGQYVVDTTSKEIFKYSKKFRWMTYLDMLRKATESEKKSVKINK